ncbi:MAG: TonB-dependent receptor plug domain-containing protein, partial [Chitinophagaceae bacterium]|nr:TonB-dependent receptor plug domain-containing protein [Chitinophagaceae bacterium]
MKKSFSERHGLSLRPGCLLVLFFLLSGPSLFAQNKTVAVRGTVSSTTGEPLAGGSVLEKGSTKGVSVQADGRFQITVPQNATLVISFTGYITKEVKVGTSDQTFNIQLLADKNELNQVVVVGYGTRKKVDVTGAITSISAQSIQDVPSANLAQALQGQGAGIDIQKSGGNSKPGQSPSILIRGTRSVQAGNSPLFVIDGIAFDGNINDFNLDDVASIDILKDASSTAIYGSRGANGVILITTKRGRNGDGRPVISYNSYTGFTKSMGEYPMMDGPQYLELKKWANFIGKPGTYTGIDDPKILVDAFSPEERVGIATGRSTDWQKLVYKTGITTSHQIGVSGGNDRTQYSVSGGYYNEGGVYFG